MEEKLMGLFTYFELSDFIGFAKLLNVDNELIKKVLVSSAAETQDNDKNWENLICATIENFSQKKRKERRSLLRLAMDIKKENVATKKIQDKQMAAKQSSKGEV